MSSPSPAQQAAARGMKNCKPGKFPKPGKIQRHTEGLFRRHSLMRLELRQQLRALSIEKSRIIYSRSAKKRVVGVPDFEQRLLQA